MGAAVCLPMTSSVDESEMLIEQSEIVSHWEAEESVVGGRDVGGGGACLGRV